jgi:hypothetical protein
MNSAVQPCLAPMVLEDCVVLLQSSFVAYLPETVSILGVVKTSSNQA